MIINKILSLSLYSEYIQQENNEIDALYHDLLINVSSFFRDPDAFQHLKTHLFQQIIHSKIQGESRFYRQVQMLQRDTLVLAESTIHDWFIA